MAETIQHIFATRKTIRPLWNALIDLYMRNASKCYKIVSFHVCNVIVGFYTLNGENRILNFVTLYTKQYIQSNVYIFKFKTKKDANILGCFYTI